MEGHGAPDESGSEGGGAAGALPPGVRELDHTADTGIDVRADDLPQLFHLAALGLRALALASDRLPGPDAAAGPGTVLELDASDTGAALVRWLNELLYRIDALGYAYKEADIDVDGGRVRAVVREDRLEGAGAQIKAVTYHGLECGPDPRGGWSARIIFDI